MEIIIGLAIIAALYYAFFHKKEEVVQPAVEPTKVEAVNAVPVTAKVAETKAPAKAKAKAPAKKTSAKPKAATTAKAKAPKKATKPKA